MVSLSGDGQVPMKRDLKYSCLWLENREKKSWKVCVIYVTVHNLGTLNPGDQPFLPSTVLEKNSLECAYNDIVINYIDFFICTFFIFGQILSGCVENGYCVVRNGLWRVTYFIASLHQELTTCLPTPSSDDHTPWALGTVWSGIISNSDVYCFSLGCFRAVYDN